MTYTTLVTTDELAAHITDPDWVVLDARFTLDDESWGTTAYSEGHLPRALRADHRGGHRTTALPRAG
jgi:thiosulfate/3-mercaptopyruvate sulfurtransferase